MGEWALYGSHSTRRPSSAYHGPFIWVSLIWLALDYFTLSSQGSLQPRSLLSDLVCDRHISRLRAVFSFFFITLSVLLFLL
ncbi:hypothetical protein F4820DRAFT_432696 [Hypoxylon rubiginosum]|uniref:Uncharacterized protein n=1 Tax=Hypoxylon rubiginosum TaxID=110542 RepID=A0ACB9YQK7_9PEZI|nr:hypothetical protein F4820DRAFT_432696 [Hypoxylon rubiginosum]